MQVPQLNHFAKEYDLLQEKRERLLGELELFGDEVKRRLEVLLQELEQFSLEGKDSVDIRYNREVKKIVQEEKLRVHHEYVDFISAEVERRFQEEFKFRLQEKREQEIFWDQFEEREQQRQAKEGQYFLKRTNTLPKSKLPKHLNPSVATGIAEVSRNPVMEISIDIGSGKQRKVIVHHEDLQDKEFIGKAVELAHKFCKENRVQPEFILPLSKYIRTTVQAIRPKHADKHPDCSDSSGEEDEGEAEFEPEVVLTQTKSPVKSLPFSSHGLASPKVSEPRSPNRNQRPF